MGQAFDGNKNQENLAKHKIGFEQIAHFDWKSAITAEDTRYDYGEQRFISDGLVHSRLHVLVWTVRDSILRPISFRKANSRERIFYETRSA